jgi:dTDP-glucose 4,6-dehydratase
MTNNLHQQSLRIFITGGAGFIGSCLARHLINYSNHDVLVYDKLTYAATLTSLESVSRHERFEFVQGDICDKDLVSKAVSAFSPDVIVHLAAESHVDRSITQPRPFVENNVSLALTLFEYARTLTNLKTFVQIGTDEVYGPASQGINHLEWSPQIPSNPYSASKSAQEAIAISYWRTFNVPLILTNTMNIIGERQDVEKFLPLIISKLQQGKAVPVHALKKDNQWTSGSRFYLHARNQADALRFLISHFVNTPHSYTDGLERPERFNVRGEQEISNDEMVMLVARFLGESKPKSDLVDFVNVEGTRPGHDLRYALDGDKLASLGWKPPVPFEESLERTVRWTVKNPKWISL